jgi:2-polyprenyl-6-methoxyphenol hydroxylase-like FAD-dependent oxidoreductase
VDFLSSIGIWQHLDPNGWPGLRHGDPRRRRRPPGLSAYDSGLRELAWILESSLMQLELWETVKRQHNVTLLCPAAPSALAIDDTPPA